MDRFIGMCNGEADADLVLCRVALADLLPAHVELFCALERHADFDDHAGPLHLRIYDLRHATALQHVSGEGLTSRKYVAAVQDHIEEFTDCGLQVPTDRSHLFRDEFLMVVKIPRSTEIHCLRTDAMTDGECRLTSVIHRTLQLLYKWAKWDATFDERLNTHHEAGTVGAPLKQLIKSPDRGPLNLLLIVWSNVVKMNGQLKARSRPDGSKQAAPWFWDYGTIASCVEHPCIKLFFALAAVKGMVITTAQGMVIFTANTSGAYQQSPPPTRQCYLDIDNTLYRKPQTHERATPNATVTAQAKLTLSSVDATAKHAETEEQVDSYQQLLGETIYPYMLCRVYIDCTVLFKSRLAQATAPEHYQALKGICQYLRATQLSRIRYRWDRPCVHQLPAIQVINLADDGAEALRWIQHYRHSRRVLEHCAQRQRSWTQQPHEQGSLSRGGCRCKHKTWLKRTN